MKYIINVELYNKISKILCHYDTLLERLGEDYRSDTLERDFNDFSEIWAEYDDLPTYEDESIASEEECEPEVNDRVRVTDWTECYGTYSGWVEQYITEPSEKYLWDYGRACHDGDEGKVIFIAPHEYGNANLAYVKMDNGKCYLIGTRGIKKI